MKATIKLVSFFSILLVFACGTEGKKVEAKDAIDTKTTAPAPSASASGAAANFTVNKGTLTWTGSKLVGTSSHTGTIDVTLGDIKTKGDKITGGQFVIDMTSIKNTDLPAEKQGNLEGHLKNADFFDVAKYPKATFLIVGVAPSTEADASHNVTGNLTMKGITKSITFPADIAIVGNKISAVSPAFKIDRTQWGIEYGSNSIAGIAKDKIIDNDISLVLTLEATSNAVLQ